MTRRLRALVALLEDLDLIFSTQMAAPNYLMPTSDLCEYHACMWYIHIIPVSIK